MTRRGARALLHRALMSLKAQAFRSSLSALGILFGVASITAVSSVTEGARREAQAQLGDLGADMLVVRNSESAAGSNRPLSVDELPRLRAVLKEALAIAPVRSREAEAQNQDGAFPATLIGTSAEYARATGAQVEAGRGLADLDVSERRRVVVLGSGLARALFHGGSGLGERIRIESQLFEVIGVLPARAARRKASPGAPVLGRDLNRAAIVPWTSVPSGRGGERAIDEIVARLPGAARTIRAASTARRALDVAMGSGAAEVLVPYEMLRQQQRTQSVFAVVTGATSLICLIVGGAGILNILLAGVTERVREIGIRRAVGATQVDIALQFLAEGALLSGAGGALGLVGGLMASVAIQKAAGWPVALAPLTILGGVFVSIATGLLAAGYPAFRAARLEVMDALRRR